MSQRSKWAQPTDEERMAAFMAKKADVQPAYYRAGGGSEVSRMETGNEYRGDAAPAPVPQSPHQAGGGAGGVFCSNCGAKSAGKFCAGCGSPLAAAPAPKAGCSGCGAPKTGSKFCAGCGTPA